jgi:hypothetical protein
VSQPGNRETDHRKAPYAGKETLAIMTLSSNFLGIAASMAASSATEAVSDETHEHTWLHLEERLKAVFSVSSLPTCYDAQA